MFQPMQEPKPPVDEKVLAEAAIDVFLAEAPPPAVWDTMIPTRGLFIEANKTWIPASETLWRSWTGKRAVWGLEYHGPVYALAADMSTQSPFAGERVCMCSVCQSTVSHAIKRKRN